MVPTNNLKSATFLILVNGNNIVSVYGLKFWLELSIPPEFSPTKSPLWPLCLSNVTQPSIPLGISLLSCFSISNSTGPSSSYVMLSTSAFKSKPNSFIPRLKNVLWTQRSEKPLFLILFCAIHSWHHTACSRSLLSTCHSRQQALHTDPTA